MSINYGLYSICFTGISKYYVSGKGIVYRKKYGRVEYFIYVSSVAFLLNFWLKVVAFINPVVRSHCMFEKYTQHRKLFLKQGMELGCFWHGV